MSNSQSFFPNIAAIVSIAFWLAGIWQIFSKPLERLNYNMIGKFLRLVLKKKICIKQDLMDLWGMASQKLSWAFNRNLCKFPRLVYIVERWNLIKI